MVALGGLVGEADLELEVDVGDRLHDAGGLVVGPGVVLGAGGHREIGDGLAGADPGDRYRAVTAGVDQGPVGAERGGVEVVGDEPEARRWGWGCGVVRLCETGRR